MNLVSSKLLVWKNKVGRLGRKEKKEILFCLFPLCLFELSHLDSLIEIKEFSLIWWHSFYSLSACRFPSHSHPLSGPLPGSRHFWVQNQCLQPSSLLGWYSRPTKAIFSECLHSRKAMRTSNSTWTQQLISSVLRPAFLPVFFINKWS